MLETYGKLPLSFEENCGQADREVRYLSHGSGYELFLTPQEAVLALWPGIPQDLSPLRRASMHRLQKKSNAGRPTTIRMRLEGSNLEPDMVGMEQLPGSTNYFIGNDPKNWHTDVPSYVRVKYSEIYPGVDLIFYGNQRRLEYDFVVAPNGNPYAIALSFEGTQDMRINSSGDLVMNIANGEINLRKPAIYQTVYGQRHEITGRYVIAENHRVKFAIGSYDRTKPLILDPVLNYSTYLGGSAGDGGFAIAVDATGNAFIAGQTMSTDFPHPAGTLGAVAPSPSPNMGASFVAELNPTGTQLLYSTYLAGTASNAFEQAFGIAVDASGKVYVTGLTFATDFPTTANALKTGLNAGNVKGTSYVTKLDPTQSGASSLLYSSYLGGTNGTAAAGGDTGMAIAADANGVAYIAGYTDSTPGAALQNFPVLNGFQTTLNCSGGNAFLSKVDTTKSGNASLLYSTYLGGTCANLSTSHLGFGEDAFGVAIDAASGNAYLAGYTSSTDYPTFGNAHQPTAPAGNTQGTAFFTQIDTTKVGAASGIYSTYLGGATFDLALAIALGPNKVAYVTGTTDSNNFPVVPNPGAFDTSGAAAGKAFVSIIDTTLGAVPSLKYSTFLGGSGGDSGHGIAVDASGNAYVAGTTASTDFPFPPKAMIVGGFEPTYPAGAKNVGFISKLSPSGNGKSDLLYSTFFGGIGSPGLGDQTYAIAIDSSNPVNAYITGQTFSTAATFPVFPTTAPMAFQTTLNGPSDAYVAKLSLIPTLVVSPTSLSFGTVATGTTSPTQTVILTNNTGASIAFTSATIVNGSPAAATTDYVVSANTCNSGIPSGTSPANQCTVSLTLKPSVAAMETATLQLMDADSTSPQLVALSGTGSASAPVVMLAPTSLSFGNQPLNTTSAAMNVTLTNTGNAPLTINSIGPSGDFAETSTGAGACPISPATLSNTAGSNTCTISVTFTPTALGVRNGTLSVTDNASGSPHTVSLTGTGVAVPGVGLAPTSLTFSGQMLTTTSTAKIVTLTNTGGASLTINTIGTSGDFAQTNNCGTLPAMLAPNANCAINVTFAPTAVGGRNGALTITDNATGSPHMVPLTGTGWDFTITAPSSESGKSPLTFNATMTPLGGFNQSVTLTCTGAPPGTTCTVATPVMAADGMTAQNAQVTLTRNGGGLIMPSGRKLIPPISTLRLVPLILAVMLFFLLPKAKGLRVRLGMATAMVLLLVMAGCGGHAKITGSLTITGMSTGTAGSVSHSAQVAFTLD